MIVPVSELILYCRADDDSATSQLLESLGAAAEAYLAAACGVDYQALSADQQQIYQLAVKQQVLYNYDHPDGGEPPQGMRNSINAIKAFQV